MWKISILDNIESWKPETNELLYRDFLWILTRFLVISKNFWKPARITYFKKFLYDYLWNQNEDKRAKQKQISKIELKANKLPTKTFFTNKGKIFVLLRTRFVFQWFVFWWFHFEFQFWISTVKRNRKIGATTAAWLQNPFWKHVFTQINFDKVWYLIGEFYKVWTKLHSS